MLHAHIDSKIISILRSQVRLLTDKSPMKRSHIRHMKHCSQTFDIRHSLQFYYFERIACNRKYDDPFSHILHASHDSD